MLEEYLCTILMVSQMFTIVLGSPKLHRSPRMESWLSS